MERDEEKIIQGKSGKYEKNDSQEQVDFLNGSEAIESDGSGENAAAADTKSGTGIAEVTYEAFNENDLDQIPTGERAVKGRVSLPFLNKIRTGSGMRKTQNVADRRHFINKIVYISAICLVSLIVTLLILSVLGDMYGVAKEDKKINIKIPSGATSSSVAEILKKDGVIRYGFVFKAFMKTSKESGFQTGTYTLNSNMGYDDIVKTLKDQRNNSSLIKVTIPEGYTIQKIGETLEKDKICSQQDFMNAVQNETYKSSNLSQIPDNSNRFYKLEGYLFPDSYNLLLDSSGKTVVQKMISNFDNKFDSTLMDKAKQMNMTVDQVVTLASIIQAEASKTSEMGRVSSVFHNRLSAGIGGKKLLQSDATIFYAKRDIQPILKSSDTSISSAYNTYKNEGLTPGPICNPGIEAIKAALNPENTSYYYFVTDKNGNYYYSDTYAQHVTAVNKAMKTGAATGTNVVK